jgi:hypothetical protein
VLVYVYNAYDLVTSIHLQIYHTDYSSHIIHLQNLDFLSEDLVLAKLAMQINNFNSPIDP